VVTLIITNLLLCSTCFAWDPADYTAFLSEQIEGQNKIKVSTYSTWIGPGTSWPIRTDDEDEAWRATVTAYDQNETQLGNIEVPEEAGGVVDYSDYVSQGIKFIRVTQGSGSDSGYIEVVVTTYAVALMSDGVVYKTETVLPDQTLNEPVAPVKENFIFNGWYENEAFTKAVSFPYTVTENATFYAKWADSDLTAYNKALAAVEKSEYTEESWADYQKVVKDNAVTTANSQKDVDAATAAILAAQEDLVFAGKADLLAAVTNAEKLNKTDYTEASWSSLTTALAMPEASNAELIAKTKAINEAISSLKKVEASELPTNKQNEIVKKDKVNETFLPKTGTPDTSLLFLIAVFITGTAVFFHYARRRYNSRHSSS
jgi:uncharacterized repeat protein (TIGR02543 family)/LPXTG-motif cell wall-anchored protein